MDAHAVHAHVRGIVQGVGFRWFVLRRARELGLRGHTRNLPDGSVEIVAVGARPDVDTLIEHVRTGPPASRVDAVECRDVSPVPRYDDFDIRG